MMALTARQKRLRFTKERTTAELIERINNNDAIREAYYLPRRRRLRGEQIGRIRGVWYVNVYRVTRHYGGPEEGGWYYNLCRCVASYPVTRSNARGVYAAVRENPEYQSEGDIYSVLGGVRVYVYLQPRPAQSEDLRRPHYE